MNKERMNALINIIMLDALWIFTSICTIAFGVDRWTNHNLWIGGTIFIVIGIISLGIMIIKVVVAMSESKEKK